MIYQFFKNRVLSVFAHPNFNKIIIGAKRLREQLQRF